MNANTTNMNDEPVSVGQWDGVGLVAKDAAAPREFKIPARVRGEVVWTHGVDAGRRIFEAMKPVLSGQTFFAFSVDFGVMNGNGVVTLGFDTPDVDNVEVRADAAETALGLLAEALAKKGGA